MQQIREHTDVSQCNYVPSKMNPADCASWGLTGSNKKLNFKLDQTMKHTPLLYFVLTYFLHCNWYLLCTLKFFFFGWLIFVHCNRYLFCTLNFSPLIEIDHWEEKLALWYIVKCHSIEWLFTDYFCLIIWYATGSCLSCCYFLSGVLCCGLVTQFILVSFVLVFGCHIYFTLRGLF